MKEGARRKVAGRWRKVAGKGARKVACVFVKRIAMRTPLLMRPYAAQGVRTRPHATRANAHMKRTVHGRMISHDTCLEMRPKRVD